MATFLLERLQGTDIVFFGLLPRGKSNFLWTNGGFYTEGISQVNAKLRQVGWDGGQRAYLPLHVVAAQLAKCHVYSSL